MKAINTACAVAAMLAALTVADAQAQPVVAAAPRDGMVRIVGTSDVAPSGGARLGSLVDAVPQPGADDLIPAGWSLPAAHGDAPADMFARPAHGEGARSAGRSMIAQLPEPASWTMMILGIGMVGHAIRRRVRASEAAFDARIKRIAAGEDG